MHRLRNIEKNDQPEVIEINKKEGSRISSNIADPGQHLEIIITHYR
jgi:hypothetical protein